MAAFCLLCSVSNQVLSLLCSCVYTNLRDDLFLRYDFGCFGGYFFDGLL